MLKILKISLLFLGLSASGQSYFKDNAISLSCLFAAGCMDATAEILQCDYSAFKQVFQKANDEFWNPNISYLNKWKNGNPANGPAFFGSTTIFVWTTDGYHLTRTLDKAFICTGIAFKMGDWDRKWYIYIIDFIAHSLAYSIGFNLTFHVVFKHEW